MEVLPPWQPNQEIMGPGLWRAGYWRDVEGFKGHLCGDVYRCLRLQVNRLGAVNDGRVGIKTEFRYVCHFLDSTYK